MTTVKAGTLRRAAEAADGMRGQEVYLQIGQDDFVITEQKPANQDPDRLLITCHTCDYPVPDRPNLLSVVASTRKGSNSKAHSLRDDYDAVFWSESAIEKFVQPYYARMYGVDAGVRLRLMQEAWRDPDVFAFAHLPKSEPYALHGLIALPSGATIIESNFHILAAGEHRAIAMIPEKYALEPRDNIREEAVS
ncbi:hypothetical protein [Longimicrobium terrae]|uniref:Uncharacterized protein n=1 Tax=Longimicrobium terrae TaxID=1639882 RepID=A0A841GZY9_9BACT|nr:hypothetical protein [Longimicrobium terrae]MBB4637075.1 hypothetical protein [Longimicrobium terrae]MBB6071317.1 hypothetical protein [Longimicrobium terrae]NNC31464.1 hypothetical protein [Longimicrobium terrae]